MTTKSAMELVEDAKRQIENLTPGEVQREIAVGNVTLIDLRESDELQENGKIEGSIHAPRALFINQSSSMAHLYGYYAGALFVY